MRFYRWRGAAGGEETAAELIDFTETQSNWRYTSKRVSSDLLKWVLQEKWSVSYLLQKALLTKISVNRFSLKTIILNI